MKENSFQETKIESAFFRTLVKIKKNSSMITLTDVQVMFKQY